MPRTPIGSPRGFTLIEVTVALAILLIGLLGMLKLQFMGMGANHAARAQTVATQVARELVAGLESVPLGSPLLTAQGAGATAPTSFGPLATGPASRATGATPYSDASPLPGTRTNAQLTAERADMTFDRRWTVWDYQPDGVAASGVGNGAAAKLVAVSVQYTYHQTGPAGSGSGEVVLYLQRANPGVVLGGVAAYR
jgi:type IV pilus modification protein PilV